MTNKNTLDWEEENINYYSNVIKQIEKMELTKLPRKFKRFYFTIGRLRRKKRLFSLFIIVPKGTEGIFAWKC